MLDTVISLRSHRDPEEDDRALVHPDRYDRTISFFSKLEVKVELTKDLKKLRDFLNTALMNPFHRQKYQEETKYMTFLLEKLIFSWINIESSDTMSWLCSFISVDISLNSIHCWLNYEMVIIHKSLLKQLSSFCHACICHWCQLNRIAYYFSKRNGIINHYSFFLPGMYPKL